MALQLDMKFQQRYQGSANGQPKFGSLYFAVCHLRGRNHRGQQPRHGFQKQEGLLRVFLACQLIWQDARLRTPPYPCVAKGVHEPTCRSMVFEVNY